MTWARGGEMMKNLECVSVCVCVYLFFKFKYSQLARLPDTDTISIWFSLIFVCYFFFYSIWYLCKCIYSLCSIIGTKQNTHLLYKCLVCASIDNFSLSNLLNYDCFSFRYCWLLSFFLLYTNFVFVSYKFQIRKLY